ncbi:MAG: hypothetical protein ACRD0A_00495 [Acidimicrobiales bacterium]
MAELDQGDVNDDGDTLDRFLMTWTPGTGVVNTGAATDGVVVLSGSLVVELVAR